MATHIADTSAFGRIPRVQEIEDRLVNLMDRYLLATCAMLDLEALYSAKSPSDYEAILEYRSNSMELLETHDKHWERAIEVQSELAKTSRHRAVKLPDLIIAAVAEEYGLTLLHYDGDFDIIAGITSQPVEWIVSVGSLA
jgi:predicted nucleic acid-binding protein